MLLSAQYPLSVTKFSYAVKMSLLVFLAAVATFSLFVLMSQLVADNGSYQTVENHYVPISISQVKDDSDVDRIKKALPKPPAIKPMPKPTKTVTETTNSDSIMAPDGSNLLLKPSIQLPNLLASNKNIGALPVVRVPPKYPKKAAMQGIEGWVKLSFSIDQLGAVTDVAVLESNPARIFNRAATAALKKWKYKPQLVEGEAMKQTGQVIVLEFNLDKN